MSAVSFNSFRGEFYYITIVRRAQRAPMGVPRDDKRVFLFTHSNGETEPEKFYK
eukprot:gene3815-4607_t